VIAFIRKLGVNYLWGLANFTAGAVLTAIMAFSILTAIYHAGVCR
jgi:hypothetical protein